MSESVIYFRDNRPPPRPSYRREKGRKRIIVAGSRTFDSWPLLCRKLDHYTQNLRDPIILTGGAKGADEMAMEWAGYYWYTCRVYHPDWDTHGKKAGILRNIEMAKEADALIAFWNGKSRGTLHMIKEARRRGLLVKVVRFHDPPKIKIVKEQPVKKIVKIKIKKG